MMYTVQLRNSILGWCLVPSYRYPSGNEKILNILYADNWLKMKPRDRAFMQGQPVAEVKKHIVEVCKEMNLGVSFCGNLNIPYVRIWERKPKQIVNAKLVDFAQGVIAGIYGCDKNNIGSISKRVYKYTSCGAWCNFDESGIEVGTIVEGSDATYSEHICLKGLRIGEGSAKKIKERFFAALQRCEDFAAEVWAEMESKYTP